MNDIFYYIVLKHAVKAAYDEFDCLERGRLRRVSKKAKVVIDEYDFACPEPKQRGDTVMWMFLREELVRQPIFLIVILDHREWTYTFADVIEYFQVLETVVVGDYLKPLNVIKKNYKTVKKHNCPARICKSKDFEATRNTKCLILDETTQFVNVDYIKTVLRNGGIVINLCTGRQNANNFCLNNSAAYIDS